MQRHHQWASSFPEVSNFQRSTNPTTIIPSWASFPKPNTLALTKKFPPFIRCCSIQPDTSTNGDTHNTPNDETSSVSNKASESIAASEEVAEKIMEVYEECLQGNFRSVEILREARKSHYPPATQVANEGCLLQGESVGVLKEGIGYLLNSWRPLRITVANKWAGYHSSVKAYPLAIDVHSWFIRSTELPDVVDLQTFLESELVCSFCIPVEDCNVKKLAEKIMAMYEECVQGNFRSVEILREASEAQPAHPPATQVS